MTPLELFAITAPGLEPIVARELVRLGETPLVEEGGVSWRGDATSMMRANLWLRAASRVLVRVAKFRATAFYELEKRAKRIPWTDFIAGGQSAEFRVTARKSKLYHSDAIAQRLEKITSRDGANAATTGKQLFVVRVLHDDFEISADSSGALLHMRGYRQAVAKAPLRETLAAALLLAADWNGTTPLLDPMCGSGTIAIEGALIARRIAPGSRREFAFAQWPSYDVASWKALVKKAQDSELEKSAVLLAGSDRDVGAVEAASANADRAGVAADVSFGRMAISAVEPLAEAGLVATNPPYGVRVGAGADVRNLYAQLGHTLRARFKGWRIALYATSGTLTSQLGIPLRTAFRTTNGGIKVAGSVGEIV